MLKSTPMYSLILLVCRFNYFKLVLQTLDIKEFHILLGIEKASINMNDGT